MFWWDVRDENPDAVLKMLRKKWCDIRFYVNARTYLLLLVVSTMFEYLKTLCVKIQADVAEKYIQPLLGTQARQREEEEIKDTTEFRQRKKNTKQQFMCDAQM